MFQSEQNFKSYLHDIGIYPIRTEVEEDGSFSAYLWTLSSLVKAIQEFVTLGLRCSTIHIPTDDDEEPIYYFNVTPPQPAKDAVAIDLIIWLN